MRIIILALAVMSCSCKTVSLQRYFPAHNSVPVIFTKEIDSTKESYIDTLICREIAVHTIRQFISIYSISVEGRPIVRDTGAPVNLYWFEKPANYSDSSFLNHDHSFMGKACCYKNKRLYIGNIFKSEAELEGEMRLLFPRRIRQNVDYKDRNGDYWKSYEYIAKESVEVNGVVYHNCIKMDVFETLGGSKRIGTVWLAKNVGLVKWEIKNEKVPFRYLTPTNRHGWESHKRYNYKQKPVIRPTPDFNGIP